MAMQSTSEKSNEDQQRRQEQQLPGKLAEDLRVSLSNPNLCDLTLVGADDERVAASRFLIAARSKVFERMLYGNFREGSSDEVRLAYSGAALRGIVEYCCTDSIEPFEESFSERNECSTRSYVQLYAAAHFFGFQKLQEKADGYLNDELDCYCELACAVYDEALLAGAPNILDAALDTLTSYPRACFFPGRRSDGVSLLSKRSLREVVKVKDIAATTVFAIVDNWMKVENSKENANPDDTMKFAKEIIGDINLCDIAPKDLLGSVADSSIFDSGRIFNALREQAQEDCVYVAGAGAASANGRYDKAPYKFKKFDVYTKSGRCAGEDVKFFIYHSRVESYNGSKVRGFIGEAVASCCNDNELPISAITKRYESEGSTGSKYPLRNNWKVTESNDFDLKPVPTVIGPAEFE